MDKTESDFVAKLLATFRIEAEEHLKTLSDGLLALEGDVPQDKRKTLVENVFREAHSLKGAARSVNHEMIQSICQSLENVLSSWKKGTLYISGTLFDTLHETIDLITKLVSLPPNGENAEHQTSFIALIERLDQHLIAKMDNASAADQPTNPESKIETSVERPLQAANPYQASQSISSIAKEQTKSEAESNLQEKKTEELKGKVPPKEPTKLEPEAVEKPKILRKTVQAHEPVKHEQDSTGQAFSNDKTIRVSLLKLDKLFQEAEEMLMLKLAARQQVNDLKSMQSHLKQWDKKWGRVQSDIHTLREIAEGNKVPQEDHHELLSKSLEFIDWQQQFIKALKDNFNQSIKKAAQDYRLASGTVDVLLDDTRKVLMQPFSTLLDVFPRMVRDISRSQSKEVHFEVLGGEIEIDRRILEEMKDPLIHIIRNCIDHGIESPEIRTKANKVAFGTIKIVASQVSGNSMELLISDDGQGINSTKVKECAVKQGLLSVSDAAAMSERESLMMIFQSGISTNPIITDLSGRGLGLGIVSEKVDKLGGQIFVETKEGEGSSFRIVLPLTLATFRGIQVKVADQHFIIPSHNIKRIIRVRAEEIKSVENREMISLDGKALSFVPLSSILQIMPLEEKNHTSMIYAVIVKSAEKLVAFGVDQVLSEQEVLVKSLGAQLKRVKNILAATITESGQVIPILNPQDIMKSAVKTQVIRNQPKAIKEEGTQVKKKVILVAEDSITSRMLLKNILETAGYTVKASVDGMDAFSVFRIEKVDLILSDVDMPRMDGFVLTEKVRSLDKGKKIPIVLCTARDTPEDREHGIEVGANAYLEKSRFTQSYLLDIIEKLL